MKQVIESNIFHQLILATEDYDFNVKKEAVIAIMNICLSSSLSLSTTLINKGVFRILIELIETKGDNLLVDMALTSIDCLLQTGIAFKSVNGVNAMCKKFAAEGGVSALENLQSHSNNVIYKKGMSILGKYFDSNGDDVKLTESSSNIGNYNNVSNNNSGNFINFNQNNNLTPNLISTNQFSLPTNNLNVKYNYNGPNGIENGAGNLNLQTNTNNINNNSGMFNFNNNLSENPFNSYSGHNLNN